MPIWEDLYKISGVICPVGFHFFYRAALGVGSVSTTERITKNTALSLSQPLLARKCVPRVRCGQDEVLNKGNCCDAQAFKYKKNKRFLRHSRVSCAKSISNVYLTPKYYAACILASSRASCGVIKIEFERLRQAFAPLGAHP